MAEIGYFFTSAAGDRKYTAADFADLFYQLSQRQSGVIRGLDNTLALSNNGTLSIDVATGVAQKAGYLYQNTAAMNIVLDAVTSGSKRIDRVVIRVDLTARQVVATVLKGVESGTPSAPAITGSTDVLLGKILLDRSSGSYAYTVTDERTYSDALLAPATIKKFNEGTYTLDDLPEGSTYKRVTADAVGTGNKIDLSKSGFIGKTLDNIADTATYVKVTKAVADAINSSGTLPIASLKHKDATGNNIDFASDGKTTFGNDIVLGSSKGIVFDGTVGGTVTSKTLDDYEEGTWTPILVGTTGNPTGVTYASQSGVYTKIGRTVFYHVHLRYTTFTGGSGGLGFSLPFAASSTVATCPALVENITFDSGKTYPVALISDSNATGILFAGLSGGTYNVVTFANNPSGSSTKIIFASGSYNI